MARSFFISAVKGADLLSRSRCYQFIHYVRDTKGTRNLSRILHAINFRDCLSRRLQYIQVIRACMNQQLLHSQRYLSHGGINRSCAIHARDDIGYAVQNK
jgi:hypothetical protein